jgi:hypothetical protein
MLNLQNTVRSHAYASAPYRWRMRRIAFFEPKESAPDNPSRVIPLNFATSYCPMMSIAQFAHHGHILPSFFSPPESTSSLSNYLLCVISPCCVTMRVISSPSARSTDSPGHSTCSVPFIRAPTWPAFLTTSLLAYYEVPCHYEN